MRPELQIFLVLIASAFICLGASGGGCSPCLNGGYGGFCEVSVDQARQMLQDSVLVVDIRVQNLYETSHIPGAINACFCSFPASFDQISDRKTEDILIYASNDALRATAPPQLVYLGFTNIHFMVGGFDEWVERGFETEGQ
ncbi:rhodanese-like domain-containing protein [Candidatus Hydrogenedentota bacterium]